MIIYEKLFIIPEFYKQKLVRKVLFVSHYMYIAEQQMNKLSNYQLEMRMVKEYIETTAIIVWILKIRPC